MLGVKEVYIVESRFVDEVQKEINKRLGKGWELYGKLTVSPGPSYTQMMVKLKDPDASGNRNKK